MSKTVYGDLSPVPSRITMYGRLAPAGVDKIQLPATPAALISFRNAF